MGPGRHLFVSSQAWNWGPQELVYGYVLAANTSVIRFPKNSSRRDGGKVNCRSFRRRRPSLSSILPLAVAQSGGNQTRDLAGDSGLGGDQVATERWWWRSSSAVGTPQRAVAESVVAERSWIKLCVFHLLLFGLFTIWPHSYITLPFSQSLSIEFVNIRPI